MASAIPRKPHLGRYLGLNANDLRNHGIAALDQLRIEIGDHGELVIRQTEKLDHNFFGAIQQHGLVTGTADLEVGTIDLRKRR